MTRWKLVALLVVATLVATRVTQLVVDPGTVEWWILEGARWLLIVTSVWTVIDQFERFVLALTDARQRLKAIEAMTQSELDFMALDEQEDVRSEW